MDNQTTKRVMIVGSGSLFDEGLMQLLADKTSLEVSRLAYSTDSAFLQYFQEQRPEVVVLFEGGPLGVKRVFDLIGDTPGLTTLRVITVMAESSTVEIHQNRRETQQVQAVKSDVFFSLIQQSKSPEDSP
jgi:DNA-binding NarL/FixJ family response regulator